MQKKKPHFLQTIFMPVISLGVLLFFLAALTNLSQDRAAEDKQQLERALTKAAVSCYAIEGAYPPSLEYLVERYGIQINPARYTVKYELFASNFMPDITVVEHKK